MLPADSSLPETLAAKKAAATRNVIFAEARADMLFGDDWVAHPDLWFVARPHTRYVVQLSLGYTYEGHDSMSAAVAPPVGSKVVGSWVAHSVPAGALVIQNGDMVDGARIVIESEEDGIFVPQSFLVAVGLSGLVQLRFSTLSADPSWILAGSWLRAEPVPI